MSFLNSAGLFDAIPDSEDLHARYDATEIDGADGESIATWSDQTGNGFDLTQSTSTNQPTLKTSIINGNPVVRFDGSDDFLTAAFSEIAQPFHIFGVFQLRSVASSDFQVYYDEEGSAGGAQLGDENTGTFYFQSGTVVTGSTADTNANISAAFHDGASSVLRFNGADIATGDIGANGLNGFTAGVDGNQDTNSAAPIDWGEILIYPQDKSSIQGDVESYLSDKWGITI